MFTATTEYLNLVNGHIISVERESCIPSMVESTVKKTERLSTKSDVENMTTGK